MCVVKGIFPKGKYSQSKDLGICGLGVIFSLCFGATTAIKFQAFESLRLEIMDFHKHKGTVKVNMSRIGLGETCGEKDVIWSPKKY